MELHFLGTGSAFPAPKRNASCTVFRHEKGLYMFDCGEGAQIQFHKSPLRPNQIKKIFITHLHGDHLFGLQGLLCSIGMHINWDPTSQKHIDIYGPVGLRCYLRTCLRCSYANLPFTYSVHEVVLPSNKEFYHSLDIPYDQSFWECISQCDNNTYELPEHPNEVKGKTINVNELGYYDICNDDGLEVKAAVLKHTVPCIGYVIQEDDLPGKLDITLLKAKNIPPGPLYGKLKKGETIQLDNGETIRPEDCVGAKRKGRKLVILGDTYNSDAILGIGDNPDVLVHESTNEVADEEKSIEHGHSSAGMAGLFAKKLHARRLVLTHFSQRYRNVMDEERAGTESVEKLVDEAKVTFSSQNVIAAHDLMVVTLPLPK